MVSGDWVQLEKQHDSANEHNRIFVLIVVKLLVVEQYAEIYIFKMI